MELTLLNIGVAMAIGVAAAGYIVYIFVPAVSSYGRPWERVAAGFLSLFVLAALLGLGLMIGVSLVWFYDTYA